MQMEVSILALLFPSYLTTLSTLALVIYLVASNSYSSSLGLLTSLYPHALIYKRGIIKNR